MAKHPQLPSSKWMRNPLTPTILLVVLSVPALAQKLPPASETKNSDLPTEMQPQIQEMVGGFVMLPFANTKLSSQGEKLLNQVISREVAKRPTKDLMDVEVKVNFSINEKGMRSLYPTVCAQALPLLSKADRAGVQSVCTELVSQ